jgi:hypothetical protein
MTDGQLAIVGLDRQIGHDLVGEDDTQVVPGIVFGITLEQRYRTAQNGEGRFGAHDLAPRLGQAGQEVVQGVLQSGRGLVADHGLHQPVEDCPLDPESAVQTTDVTPQAVVHLEEVEGGRGHRVDLVVVRRDQSGVFLVGDLGRATNPQGSVDVPVPVVNRFRFSVDRDDLTHPGTGWGIGVVDDDQYRGSGRDYVGFQMVQCAGHDGLLVPLPALQRVLAVKPDGCPAG